MRGSEFLEEMELIAPDYVAEAEEWPKRKKSIWVMWGAVAACLSAVLAITLPLVLSPGREGPVSPGTQPSVSRTENPETPKKRTSETYDSLAALLEYLGTHETHGDRKGTETLSELSKAAGTSNGTREAAGFAVSEAGDYVYCAGKHGFDIFRLSGAEAEKVGTIETEAQTLLLYRHTLFVLSTSRVETESGKETESVRVSLYDIRQPETPVRKEDYVQRGRFSQCWLSGDSLYLVTEEGVCACGYSREDDTAAYYPALSQAGRSFSWGEAEISVLGEPTQVRYAALSVISGETRKVVRKNAFYGDITQLFYGADWLAVATATPLKRGRDNPILYTFDGEFRYTGKVETAAALGLSKAREGDKENSGESFDIASVTKSGALYRVIGNGYERTSGRSEKTRLLVLTADAENETVTVQGQTGTGYKNGAVTEVRWEENRAVVCLGINTLSRRETRFFLVTFDGPKIDIYETDQRADYVDQTAESVLGVPLGEIDTLIPLGGGRYARYTGTETGPGGFDLYDFSENNAPKCRYKAETSLSGKGQFDYVWLMYDEHTLGVLKWVDEGVKQEKKRYFFWCWYTVNFTEETPITLRGEQELESVPHVAGVRGAKEIGLEVFRSGDTVYGVMQTEKGVRVLTLNPDAG